MLHFNNLKRFHSELKIYGLIFSSCVDKYEGENCQEYLGENIWKSLFSSEGESRRWMGYSDFHPRQQSAVSKVLGSRLTPKSCPCGCWGVLGVRSRPLCSSGPPEKHHGTQEWLC